MRTTLQLLSGPRTGRRLDVRDGFVARFGRTDWADFSFPEDAEMADVHFLVDCRGGCRLQALVADKPVLVNGEATRETVLHTGDELQAGQTKFAVDVEGESAPLQENDTEATEPEPEPVVPKLCEYLSIDEADRELAQPSHTTEQFLAVLVAAKRFLSALKWQAFLLPKRECVWWGCVALESDCQSPPAQRTAYNAAREWVTNPDEEHRRAAESAAERAGYEGPGGLLAAAAFWSGDNIAPANSPSPVPSDERFTATAVSGALVAASYRDSLKAVDRQQEFLRLGGEVSRDRIPPRT